LPEDLFARWTRAKAADAFGSVGPVVCTDRDLNAVIITAMLNQSERRRYTVADYVFLLYEIISCNSRDMTLLPGDVIACGTSLGIGSMKAGSKIEMGIDGIVALVKTME